MSFVPQLTVSGLSREQVTLTVTGVDDCDGIVFVYKNIYPFHLLRNWNKLYLYRHESTFPTTMTPIECVCLRLPE